MPRINDLSNQQIGCLKVLKATDQRSSNGSIIWKCECVECHSILYIPSKRLKPGSYATECPECGKLKEIGKTYGELTVEAYVDSDQAGHHWRCRCSCGNTTIASTSSLHAGVVQSCGCLQRKRASEASLIDLTGQRFGRWTVLGRGTTTTAVKQVKWLCECSCAKHTRREVAGVELRRGTSLSCGCLRASHGEYKISMLLTNANIPFETEKKFSTCILPSGIPARFDFYVNNYYLIEFDGIQHYSDT